MYLHPYNLTTNRNYRSQKQNRRVTILFHVLCFLVAVIPHHHPPSVGVVAVLAFYPPTDHVQRTYHLHQRQNHNFRRTVIMPSSSDPSEESNNNKKKKNDSTFTAAMTEAVTEVSTTDPPKEETTEANTNKSNKKNDIQRKTWNPLRLAVLRLKMTEPAMTSPLNYGKYNDDENGTFRCAYCDHILFPSYAKYNSGTGWPSFWRTTQNDSVSYHREWDGRLECQCANCQSHLGHVFLDGPHPSTIVKPEYVSSAPSTDPRSSNVKNNYLPRFCINGLALTYQKNKS